MEVMDSFLPAEGVEYYYYDQLETGESDKPDDPDLWTLERYVDEVDQVRKAIGGTRTISACSVTAGAACSAWNMRWRTRTI